MDNINDTNQAPPKEPSSSEKDVALKKYNLWYASLSEEQKKIESDIKYFEKGRHFGTTLDELNPKQIPPMYVGLDFQEMTHDQLRKFFMATDREKFEMAYWAQTIHSRRHGTIWFWIGVGMILVLLLISLNYI